MGSNMNGLLPLSGDSIANGHQDHSASNIMQKSRQVVLSNDSVFNDVQYWKVDFESMINKM